MHLTARANAFHVIGDALTFQVNQAALSKLDENLLVGDGADCSVGLDVTTGNLYPVGLTITSDHITGFDFGPRIVPAMPPGGAASQTISAQQNCILGNVGYGAEDISSRSLQASSNWWGAASGPFDPIANPGGMVNAIFGLVTYQPSLVAAPSCS